MKRIAMIMLALLMLLCAAQAEELPKAVQRLCGEAYPGYAVLAMDGYDDGKTGQWALVLHKSGDNALVIAERTNGGEYALTVSNPAAVPDEGEGYSRETHEISVKLSKHYKTHDRLGAFEMIIEQPGEMQWIITSELADDGRTWSNVISDYTAFDWDGRTVWWSHLSDEDGTMNYMRHQEDLQGKPLSTTSYPRLPVEGKSALAHRLDCFDAGAYPYKPDQIYGDVLEDYAKPYVPQGERLIQLDLQKDALILLVESEAGVRTLRILPHVNWQFLDTVVAGPLPANASLDLFHTDEGEVQIEWVDGETEYSFCFTQQAPNGWEPAWLMMDSTTCVFTRNSIACTEDMTQPMRNDGVRYGTHPWQEIEDIDFSAIPSTKEALLSTVDQSGYAVVNNPNPEDRLHLRELPRKDARSLGKFYNRTPVIVYKIEGEWATVGIGSLTGYMMTKYLAFGEEMDGVKCAFPQEFLKEDIEQVELRRYKNNGTPGIMNRDTAFYIIGVEEENYVLLTEQGWAGYVHQSKFYPGNG